MKHIAEEVKKSLINHDGYDDAIIVTKVRRTLKSEYVIQGNYGYGWDCEATEETLEAARAMLKYYRDNAPQGVYRIVHRRVPV